MIRSQLHEKWNISCHICKQGCHHHQWLQPSTVSWWALRELSKEKNTCDLAAINYSHSLWWALRKGSPEGERCRILARDPRCNQRNDFSCVYFLNRHSGSSVAVWELLVVAYGIQFPDQGLNSGLQPLDHQGSPLNEFLLISSKLWDASEGFWNISKRDTKLMRLM